MRKKLCLTLFFLLAVLITPVEASDIFYIKKIDDRVAYRINSWPDSSCASEDCINKVINHVKNSGDVAYIAAGDYEVKNTIDLKVGVKLYGGFADDNSENSPEERNFNEVTSLDAQGQYRVIECTGTGANNENTRLDGFVITRGKTETYGAGMYNYDTSPTIINCAFIKNSLTGDGAQGGGIYNRNSNAKIVNCSFIENSAANGGAIYNSNSEITIISCTFKKNKVTLYGGAINNKSTTATLINCLFIENSAFPVNTGTSRGGAIYTNSDLTLKNCTFINNISTKSGSEIYNSNTSTGMLNITNTIIFHNNDSQYGIDNQNHGINLKNCAINVLINNGTVQSADTIVLTSTDINMSTIKEERGDCGILHTVLKFDKNSKFVNSGVSCDVSFDQLGKPRGLKVDIGSFEYQPLSAPDILSNDLSSSDVLSPDVLAGKSFDVTLNDIADKWDINETLPSWLEFEQLSPLNGRFKCIDTPIDGTFTIFMNLLNSKGLNERHFTVKISSVDENIENNGNSGNNDNTNENENDNENNNEKKAVENSSNEGNSSCNENEADESNEVNEEINENENKDENENNNDNEEKDNTENGEQNIEDGKENEQNKNKNRQNTSILYDYDDEYKLFGCGINSYYPTIMQIILLLAPTCIKKLKCSRKSKIKL